MRWTPELPSFYKSLLRAFCLWITIGHHFLQFGWGRRIWERSSVENGLDYVTDGPEFINVVEPAAAGLITEELAAVQSNEPEIDSNTSRWGYWEPLVLKNLRMRLKIRLKARLIRLLLINESEESFMMNTLKIMTAIVILQKTHLTVRRVIAMTKTLISHKFLWVLTHFSKQLTHFSEKDTKPYWITVSTHWRHLVLKPPAYWNCSLNSKYRQHLCELTINQVVLNL